MYSMFSSTVAAISTPRGKGGIAVIRISGEDAFAICEKFIRPRSGKKISEILGGRVALCDVYDEDGDLLDESVITVFRAPHSYTGENTVEISCHGGALITKTVLEALFAAGARPALAGEFTRRALINGKLSLTDAEAVANLLEAKTEAQIMLGAEGSRNHLSREISEIRESIYILSRYLCSLILYR